MIDRLLDELYKEEREIREVEVYLDQEEVDSLAMLQLPKAGILEAIRTLSLDTWKDQEEMRRFRAGMERV